MASIKAEDGASSAKERNQPTTEQLQTLRHVPDKIPWAAWLGVAFSSAERFSYFGFTGPLRKVDFSQTRSLQLTEESRELYPESFE
jgi:hypothetical protein